MMLENRAMSNQDTSQLQQLYADDGRGSKEVAGYVEFEEEQEESKE